MMGFISGDRFFCQKQNLRSRSTNLFLDIYLATPVDIRPVLRLLFQGQGQSQFMRSLAYLCLVCITKIICLALCSFSGSFS